MPLAEDITTSRHRISAYEADSITVNETTYRQSLILSAEQIICPWAVKTLTQLDSDNLQPVLSQSPEVVLLGTGLRQKFPDSRIVALFGARGIGLEVMDNGALCRTFNILVAEDRAVVAAVLFGS